MPRLRGRSAVLSRSVTGGAACGTGSQKSNKMEEQHREVTQYLAALEEVLRAEGQRVFFNTTGDRCSPWQSAVHPNY